MTSTNTPDPVDVILDELNPDNPFDISQDERKAKAKAALQALIDTAVAEADTKARINELDMVWSLTDGCSCQFCGGDYLQDRLAQLRAKVKGPRLNELLKEKS